MTNKNNYATTYYIQKKRFGMNSMFDGTWKYYAFKVKTNGIKDGLDITGNSLEDLARKLAQLPNERFVELVANESDFRRTVFLQANNYVDVSLTQYGFVTDEELAVLGSLVARLTWKKEENSGSV